MADETLPQPPAPKPKPATPRRRLHHRAAHGVLRLVGAVVAAVAVLGTIGIWLLIREPLSLDALTPYVSRALASAEDGTDITIDHTLLTIDDHRLELLARGVHLTLRDSGAHMTLPELAIELSPRALLHGLIAPTRVILDDPTLRLERAADGSVRFGLGADAGSISDDWAERLLKQFATPSAPNQRLGYLGEFAIRHAKLIVDDRMLGTAWKVERVNIAMRRGGGAIDGDMRFIAVIDRQETSFDGGFRYRIEDGGLDLALHVDGLRPALWASLAPQLAPLAILDLPVAGDLRAAVDTAHMIFGRVAGKVTFGAGILRHPSLANGVLAVSSGSVRAIYDPAAGRVELSDVALDLGGPVITASGMVDGVGNRLLTGGWPQSLTITTGIELAQLAVDDFARVWPPALSPNTRDWVTGHIHDGQVDKLTAQLGLQVDLKADAAKPVILDRFEGTIAYRNLTVDYFPPLTAVRGVSGTGSFDRKHMEFLPTSGTVRRARVSGGTVSLTKLDTNDETAGIDVMLAGPVRDALEILDTKPLQYPHQIGLDPAQIGGNFDARIRFSFPIINHLKFAQVDFGVAGKLADLTMKKVVFDRDLSGGALSLNLDRTMLKLAGTAQLAGVPLTVSWMQSLDPADTDGTRYMVRATVDDAARMRLGFDVPTELLSGPVGLDLDFRRGVKHKASAAVSLDLKGATLALPQLSWSKAPGVAAAAKLRLDLADDQVTGIRDATLTGGGMDVALAASLTGSGTVDRVDIAHLVVGATDVSGQVARRDAGGWRIKLAGKSFDGTALLADNDKTAADDKADPPLVIDAALDRLLLGKGREAFAVRLALFSDGVHWQTAVIDAQLPGGAKTSFRLGDAAGARSFTAASDDFGALLQLLDISDNVKGGHIKLSGKVEDHGRRRVLRGRAEGGDYRIVGAPLFARLLSIASFEGMGAMLAGSGIPFTRLSADFVYGDGRIVVDHMLTYGGAIGINAHGSVEYDKATLDVAGSLAPAYSLNSVLGNIPLIGKLLMGGEGQGLFAANFRVAGSLNDPKISVNPLSALAPGVFRKLFLFDAPGPGSTAAAPDAGPTTR